VRVTEKHRADERSAAENGKDGCARSFEAVGVCVWAEAGSASACLFFVVALFPSHAVCFEPLTRTRSFKGNYVPHTRHTSYT
jgi:hypothetical protein